MRVYVPSTGRGNSSLIMTRHGGSIYASEGILDHRLGPPKDEEEEEDIHPPSRSTHHLDSNEMDRAISELRDDLEHERKRR